MNDNRRQIEGALNRRESPAIHEAHRKLKEFNSTTEWEFSCWNCGKRMTRKLADIKGPCPQCGKELSKKA